MSPGSDRDDVDGFEGVLDELITLPPQRFTAARNAAAKRLRAEGRRAAAEEIKQLARPPLSLWALNRLARTQPDVLAEFLQAAGRLREAYRVGGDVRAATQPMRDAEARVVAAAGDVVRAEGGNATEAVMERLRGTLRAAAANDEVTSELRQGLLLREPEEPSIAGLLESMANTNVTAKTKAPASDGGAQRKAVRDALAAAKSEASRARDEARAASDAEAEARQSWKRAEKLAQRAQRESDEAEKRLKDVERRLREP